MSFDGPDLAIVALWCVEAFKGEKSSSKGGYTALNTRVVGQIVPLTQGAYTHGNY